MHPTPYTLHPSLFVERGERQHQSQLVPQLFPRRVLPRDGHLHPDLTEHLGISGFGFRGVEIAKLCVENSLDGKSRAVARTTPPGFPKTALLIEAGQCLYLKSPICTCQIFLVGIRAVPSSFLSWPTVVPYRIALPCQRGLPRRVCV